MAHVTNAWRETMLVAKIGPFDARLIFAIIIFGAHWSWPTFFILLAAIGFFKYMDYKGLDFPSALRWVRSSIAGRKRPTAVHTQRRRLIKYG